MKAEDLHIRTPRLRRLFSNVDSTPMSSGSLSPTISQEEMTWRESISPASPVRLVSFIIEDQMISLYAGDTYGSRKLYEQAERLQQLQMGLKTILTNASDKEKRDLMLVLQEFNGNRSGLGYVYRARQLSQLGREYLKRQYYKFEFTDGQHHHKIDLLEDIPQSVADLMRIIRNRQEATRSFEGNRMQNTLSQYNSTRAPYRRDQGIPGEFGNAAAIIGEPELRTRKLTDQRGMPRDVFERAVKIVEQIDKSKDPNSLYARAGGKFPVGITLSGPTGTGKTSLFEAMAGQVGGYYKEIKTSDVMVMWKSQDSRNLATILDETIEFARQHPMVPVFLVFNEADGLFPPHEELTGMDDNKREFVAASKQLIDRIERLRIEAPEVRVLLCATTNHRIDDAMQGRIGQNLEVGMPDESGRAEIFSKYLAAVIAEGKKAHLQVFPDDLQNAIQEYEATFQTSGSYSEAIKPKIKQLVMLLAPVLEVCEKRYLAGREIEKIVATAYNDFLLAVEGSTTSQRMTVIEHLVPAATNFKEDKYQTTGKSPIGFVKG